jgi:hypothetical protein
VYRVFQEPKETPARTVSYPARRERLARLVPQELQVGRVLRAHPAFRGQMVKTAKTVSFRGLLVLLVLAERQVPRALKVLKGYRGYPALMARRVRIALCLARLERLARPEKLVLQGHQALRVSLGKKENQERIVSFPAHKEKPGSLALEHRAYKALLGHLEQTARMEKKGGWGLPARQARQEQRGQRVMMFWR